MSVKNKSFLVSDNDVFLDVNLTVSESKRLIAKGIINMPLVKDKLQKGMIIITKGSTNSYIAEELMKKTIEHGSFLLGHFIPAGKEALNIKKNHIKEIVFDLRKEKNPCSLCANLRRGAINSIAIREGCNKIALGHNQDDVLETFLLNLFYTGSIGTFAPVSYMDRSKITLIRPLVFTPEKENRRFVRKNNLTVMAKVCPMDGTSKREDMRQLMFSLSKNIPMIRANLFGAILRNLPEWK